MTAEHPISETGMPLSVVIAAHDQADALKRNLPKFLELHYEPGFEVIVVDESSTDGTDEVLSEMKAVYPHFYATYIPASSHYLSRRKLALTLGIKAAHHERIILTNADCSPAGENWLETIATHCSEENDVLCCYTNYDAETPDYYSYLRLKTWCMQSARPYRCEGACVVIRKSVFMQQEGFLRNLYYRRGEFDFLVNESEKAGKIEDVDGYVLQECPTRKEWLYNQLHYRCIRHRLSRTWWSRLKMLADQLLLYVVTLGTIAAAVYTFLQDNPLYSVLAVVLFLLMTALRLTLDYKRAQSHHIDIAWWKLTIFDYRYFWTMLYLRFRYIIADKSDFLRK